MPDLTPAAEDVLLHTLGLSRRDSTAYRDHFVAGPGHHANQHLVDLEAAGLMERRRRPGFLPEDSQVWGTTADGKALAAQLHRKRFPPPSRSQQRYLQWLDETDLTNEPFGAWLRRGAYKHKHGPDCECGCRAPRWWESFDDY